MDHSTAQIVSSYASALGVDTAAEIARRPLSNTLRNRIVAFAPIGVALLGLTIMAIAGQGRPATTAEAGFDGIDAIITGTIATE